MILLSFFREVNELWMTCLIPRMSSAFTTSAAAIDNRSLIVSHRSVNHSLFLDYLSLSTWCDTQTRLPWISTFVFFWFSSSGVINLHTVHQHLCIVASVPSVSVSEQSTKFVTTGGEFPFGNNAENELIPTVVQQELIKRGRAVHPPAKDEEIVLILLDNVQHSFLPTVRHTILAELLHHVRLMSQ